MMDTPPKMQHPISERNHPCNWGNKNVERRHFWRIIRSNRVGWCRFIPKTWVVGFKHFVFSTLHGEMIQLDFYFSDGSKPSTRKEHLPFPAVATIPQPLRFWCNRINFKVVILNFQSLDDGTNLAFRCCKFKFWKIVFWHMVTVSMSNLKDVSLGVEFLNWSNYFVRLCPSLPAARTIILWEETTQWSRGGGEAGWFCLGYHKGTNVTEER